MVFLRKKTITFRNVPRLTRRINKLEKLKKDLMKRRKKKDSEDLQRALRVVRESLSQLKNARRSFNKSVVSIKVFTV